MRQVVFSLSGAGAELAPINSKVHFVVLDDQARARARQCRCVEQCVGNRTTHQVDLQASAKWRRSTTNLSWCGQAGLQLIPASVLLQS